MSKPKDDTTEYLTERKFLVQLNGALNVVLLQKDPRTLKAGIVAVKGFVNGRLSLLKDDQAT